MLSYYFFSGVVVGGAMLALGLIARSLPGGADDNPQVRSLAVLMAAFAQGLGIIAATVGLMTVFLEMDEVGGAAAVVSMLVPMAVLGIPGLALCRPGERRDVRGTTSLLTMFAAGLGVLVLVVALLAVLLEEGGGASGLDPLVAALGIAGAVAAVGVGYIGARAVSAMAPLGPGETVDAEAIRSRAVMQAAVVEGVGILTLVGALLLLVLSE